MRVRIYICHNLKLNFSSFYYYKRGLSIFRTIIVINIIMYKNHKIIALSQVKPKLECKNGTEPVNVVLLGMLPVITLLIDRDKGERYFAPY